jgi:hypothetical protein
MEPEKYLPMNRAELIAHAEVLAADLAGCKQQIAMAPTYEKMIAHHGAQEARIAALEAALLKIDLLGFGPCSMIVRGVTATSETCPDCDTQTTGYRCDKHVPSAYKETGDVSVAEYDAMDTSNPQADRQTETKDE